MNKHFTFLLTLLASIVFSSPTWAESKVHLSTFIGTIEHVNSYVIYDNASAILIDAQADNANAEKLAKQIKQLNRPLTYIIITHSHADHYMGLARLLKYFPNAQVVVSNQAIKEDIIANSLFMEQKGYLSVQEMAVKNFDYRQIIQVLNENILTLDSGSKLTLEDNYLISETDHITTLYSSDLNAFFATDLAYNNIHPWLGSWMGVDVSAIEMKNWEENLNTIESKYKNNPPAIYPGHGKPGDFTIFKNLIVYMKKFNSVVESSKTRKEAYAKMIQHYPTYLEAELFLKLSLDYHIPE